MLSSNKDIPEAILTKRVTGKTFAVYLHMLKVKNSSARGVCRRLGMSSVWLATHHLNKLSELGLVNQDVHGVYHINPRPFGILRFFIVTGQWVLPHTFFYMIFFLSMGVYFLLTLPQQWNILFFTFSSIAAITNMVETIIFYWVLSKSADGGSHLRDNPEEY